MERQYGCRYDKNILTNPVQVTLRLDAALLQQLQESAKRELRSFNAETNNRLRGSFEGKATDRIVPDQNDRKDDGRAAAAINAALEGGRR